HRPPPPTTLFPYTTLFRSGRTIEHVAKERNHDVVAIFDSHRNDQALNGAEVLIDFSRTDALDEVITIATDNNIDLVIGTTGWNEDRKSTRLNSSHSQISYA